MNIMHTKDHELIAKLNQHVHDLHYKLYPQYFKPYDFEDAQVIFEDMMNHEDFLFLVLEDGKEAIGYAWIEFRDYPDNVFKVGYRSIYVHQLGLVETKKYQGYGTKMMNYINELARSRGIDLIELDYWVGNDAAVAFYNKQDFKKYREFVYRKL